MLGFYREGWEPMTPIDTAAKADKRGGQVQTNIYRVIQVTVFFNFSLTGTKGLENDKTQPFLFRIYVDISIF